MMNRSIFLARHLPQARKLAGVSQDAASLAVVEALIKGGHRREAAELIFCATEGHIRVGARLALVALFEALAFGGRPESLLQVARSSEWRQTPSADGYCVEVYKGEFLLIEVNAAVSSLVYVSR